MMRIGGKIIGSDSVYIIAEAGVNHNGDIQLAKKLIDAAYAAGADAVKFQTFTVEEIVTEHAAQAEYQRQNTGVAESQSEMLKRLALSAQDFRVLIEYARRVGIEFLSTPFSIPDADFLHTLDLAAYKVSSGDLTNLPFLAHLATFNKPILLSTGMAILPEVEAAVATIKDAGNENIVLLQCTSEYPAALSHANLAVLATLRSTFGTLVGYSDHTLGIDAAVFAAALGASIIEKHFTLDKGLQGPDHKASLDLGELRSMIDSIRSKKSVTVPEEVLGSGEKKPSPEEKVTAKLVRKGVAARVAIRAGEVLTQANIFIARPEGPIAPKDWERVLGKKALRDIPVGTSLSWDMLHL